MFYSNDIYTWSLEFLSIVFGFLLAVVASAGASVPYICVSVCVFRPNGTLNCTTQEGCTIEHRERTRECVIEILCDILLQLHCTSNVDCAPLLYSFQWEYMASMWMALTSAGEHYWHSKTLKHTCICSMRGTHTNTLTVCKRFSYKLLKNIISLLFMYFNAVDSAPANK